MQKNELSATRGKLLDAESQAMLYDGLNISQLEVILEMDKRAIREKIHQGRVASAGTRNGVDIYKLKELLPWVVKPHYNIEDYIKQMHHNELPKLLTKEFWAGQRAKQDYLEKAGNLWKTEQVVEAIGEIYKLVKMSTLLTTDAVERQVELSEAQRGIIKSIMDGMLTDLYLSIQEKFKADNDGDEAEDQTL